MEEIQKVITLGEELILSELNTGYKKIINDPVVNIPYFNKGRLIKINNRLKTINQNILLPDLIDYSPNNETYKNIYFIEYYNLSYDIDGENNLYIIKDWNIKEEERGKGIGTLQVLYEIFNMSMFSYIGIQQITNNFWYKFMDHNREDSPIGGYSINPAIYHNVYNILFTIDTINYNITEYEGLESVDDRLFYYMNYVFKINLYLLAIEATEYHRQQSIKQPNPLTKQNNKYERCKIHDRNKEECEKNNCWYINNECKPLFSDILKEDP